MTDMKYVLFGNIALVAGILITLISEHILPPLIDLITDNANLSGALWIGVYITWIFLLLVLPLGLKIYGLNMPTDHHKQLFGVMYGMVYALFTVLFVYFAWDMIIVNLTAIFTYNLVIGMYWMAIALYIIFDIFALPTYLILEARKGT